MPSARPAKTYVAHDDHPTESVIVGIDPYDTEEKAKIFSVHYRELGFLPVFVVITNDGDQPVSLNGLSAQLITANRSKLVAAEEEDVLRRLSRPSARTSNYPLPFPTGRVKGGVKKEYQEEIHNARFGAKAVEPHSTQAGFMFFDISDISNPLDGAQFYLSGVLDSKGNELMYFEIPLDKYVNAAH